MAGQGNLASGGYTSTRLDAGTGAMAAASAGGSAPPSAGGMAAVLDNLDPHAAERKNYIAQLCELTTKYSCVSPVLDVDFETGPTEQRLERCQQELDSIEYQSYGTQCWDEWVANAKCGIARTDYCPCSENDCNLYLTNFDFGLPCMQTKQALSACEQKYYTGGTSSGKAGTCQYNLGGGQGCNVACLDDPKNALSVQCSGAANGAQSCSCYDNGVFLGDIGQHAALGAYEFWYGNDCADVAQHMADGECSDILNCCVSWTYTPEGSSTPVDDCGCTADPKQAGYATCEAFAAAGSGKVVDSCWRYQPMPGTFPLPGMGGSTTMPE
jgi:hypothetical protein